MKKDVVSEMDDELRPEYDLAQLLKGGVQGKYVKVIISFYWPLMLLRHFQMMKLSTKP